MHPDMPNTCGREGCRKLKDKRTLLRHLESSKVHRNPEAPIFRCRCGGAFARKDKFRNHFRKLACTGDQPFVCWCGAVTRKTVFVSLKLTLKLVDEVREEDHARKDMGQRRKGQSLREFLQRSSSHTHRAMRCLRLSEINNVWGSWRVSVLQMCETNCLVGVPEGRFFVRGGHSNRQLCWMIAWSWGLKRYFAGAVKE